MTVLPTISSLWIGGALSYIEQLCLKSFADRGHQVKLYSYEDVGNVPSGVVRADAREILPRVTYIHSELNNSPAVTADKFRIHLLSKTDEIWVDTDAYAMRPVPDVPYIFAIDSMAIANGFLRLPRESEALKMMLDIVSSDYPDLPSDFPFRTRSGLGRLTREEYEQLGGAGKVHISALPWGTWGPTALDYCLKKTGEAVHAWPRQSLYPISGKDFRLLLNRESVDHLIPWSCYSVHLYGSALRNALIYRPKFRNNEPHANTFLADRLIDHGIDMASAPLVPFEPPEEEVLG